MNGGVWCDIIKVCVFDRVLLQCFSVVGTSKASVQLSLKGSVCRTATELHPVLQQPRLWSQGCQSYPGLNVASGSPVTSITDRVQCNLPSRSPETASVI